MIRSLKLLIFILFLFVASTSAAEEIKNLSPADHFLETRVVLGTIEFTTSSDRLPPAAKRYLDGLAPAIKKAQKDNKVIRFEGNIRSSLDNYNDVTLALYRAKAVQDYFRTRHFIGNPVFLNGSVQEVKISSTERVEIALYDFNFQIDSVPVHELITSEFTDGKK